MPNETTKRSALVARIRALQDASPNASPVAGCAAWGPIEAALSALEAHDQRVKAEAGRERRGRGGRKAGYAWGSL